METLEQTDAEGAQKSRAERDKYYSQLGKERAAEKEAAKPHIADPNKFGEAVLSANRASEVLQRTASFQHSLDELLAS
jgi:hypothetical protein